MNVRTSILISVICSGFSVAQSQNAAVSEPTVIERGPHHALRHWTSENVWPDGRKTVQDHYVTELASGLNYLKDGQWVPSEENIEIFQDGAVARKGQHQVIFAANVNSEGAIDLLTPDGQRLRSHVLGLAYLDSATGQSTLIAGAKDSFGQVIGNQVIYRDAFDGPFKADLRYTYTKGGFEQDVLIRESIPSPVDYQMNPESTRLEVWTEFLAPPLPKMRTKVLRGESDPQARRLKAVPDLVDHTLSFSSMEIGSGRAFMLEGGPNSQPSIRVAKSWVQSDGRRFLVEAVELPEVAPLLHGLPRAAAQGRQRNARAVAPANRARQMARAFPPAPARKETKPLQMASAVPSGQAMVLDYQTLNSNQTNYNFKADQTYLISGTVNLYGPSNVIEGGTVLKFAQNASATLDVKGTLIGDTSIYRPAVLTASADHTIGEGLGGALSGHYATTALNFDYVTSGQLASLQNIRILYALTAVAFNGGSGHELRHLQVVNVGTAVKADNAQYAVRNVLGWNLTNALTGSSSTGICEHATFNGVTNLVTSVTGLFTNCLLTAVVNTNGLTGQANTTLPSAAGVFKTVGSGYHYLTNGSPYRDLGTTNINPTLADELKKRSTYPPVVLSNHITLDTVLSPRAERDTSRIDIGYHYDPIDFAFSQIALSNASLTIRPGTTLGLYGANGTAGLTLQDGAKIYCEGSPAALVRIVRYNLVQELASSDWSSSSVARFISTPGAYATNLLPTEARFRFTDWSMPASGNDHFYAGATNLSLSFQDCHFRGGQITVAQPDVTIRNSLFQRADLNLDASANPFAATVRNCTIFGGRLSAQNNVSGAWTFTDNLFDTTNIVQSGSVSNNFNGYLTNSARLTPNGASDVLLSVESITYDTGWLGRFYLPTNLTSQGLLFNSGSQNATNVGLYHYTTTTNQVKEANSTVDIGFHYVAVNSSGQPIDTDSDGLPDYFEDADGDGAKDIGETGWFSPSTDADTDGDGVSDYLEYLLGRNPLVAGTTNDSSGVINLRLYTPLK